MSDLPEGIRLDTEAQRLAGIRILNERLPKKRLIAQGVLRSSHGAVLLCELTYKKDWDLPGGVVDPGESPAQCVVREIDEELGIDVTVHGLLAVNWLPPYRGWDDALLCLFDLGIVDEAVLDDVTLLRREIRSAHWVAPGALVDHVAPYTAAMLTEVLPAVTAGEPARTAYIEDSRRVRFADGSA